MLKSNGFTRDTDEDRLERFIHLSGNIDTYSVELGISPARLLWAQGAEAAWQNAISTCVIEDGEMDEAFETFNNAVTDAREYYIPAKDLLMSFIYENEKPNDFINPYGFEGDSPRYGKGLISAISTWKDFHDQLVLELNPLVVNDAIMLQLVAHRDNLRVLLQAAGVEKREASQSYDAKHKLFDLDVKQLTILFNIAKLTWGHDDPRLGELGFVPSSEVWTPGDPEPEEPEEPEEPPESVPFPGPMAFFEVKYLGGVTNSVQTSRVTGSEICVIERKGEDEWVVVAEF
ncbi:MAG: hypothetical protein KAG97_00345, partial [Victivallales bacterium]|nr:hypothetical protein [Victivallales bacterium]